MNPSPPVRRPCRARNSAGEARDFTSDPPARRTRKTRRHRVLTETPRDGKMILGSTLPNRAYGRRALSAFAATGRSWWLVALVVLLPDLFMVGYLGGTRLGAALYNAAHATLLPAVLVGIGWWQQWTTTLATGLVWLAHVGLDRLMGYGLKYSDHFQHTHLGWIGHRSGELPHHDVTCPHHVGSRRSNANRATARLVDHRRSS